MTELAIRSIGADLDLSPSHTGVERLVEWAQAADAAFQFSNRIANTAFVPTKYRGKPAEMAAAMLAGAELGINPMASLRAFHDIQGVPTPAAATLRAVVLSHGHEVVVERSDDTTAVVTGRRKGSDKWQTSTWTMDKAIKAGYPKKNSNWATQPSAMLLARATGEVCKWIGHDAIMGMPSAEEVADMGGSYDALPPQPVTAAQLIGDQAEPVRAAASDGRPEAPVSGAPLGQSEPMNKGQQGKMFALFAEKGISGANAQRQFVSETIDRQIASRSDLSKAEAAQVIDQLESMPAPQRDDDETGGASLDDPTLPDGGES